MRATKGKFLQNAAVMLAFSLFFNFMACGTVHALDPNRDILQYCLDLWGSEQGLPQNTVTSILQTRDGYLWLGTQEGLVRFDGVQFTVYDRGNTAAFENNHVQALCESRDGSLWIGIFGGGLLHYKGGAFSRMPTDDNSISNVDVAYICEASDGAIWYATNALGVYRYKNGLLRRYTIHDGLPSDQVNSLLIDSQGDIWIGTVAGLACMRNGTVVNYTTRDGLSDNSITALYQDQQGILWIGTMHGLNSFCRGTFSSYGPRKGLLNDLVRCLYMDREGSLWVGTSGGVYRLWNGRFDSLTRDSGLPVETIDAFTEDQEGSLWIGMDGGGLGRLRQGRAITYSNRHGLYNENIYSVCSDGGAGLWVGSSIDGKIDHFQGLRFAHESLKGVDPSTVRALQCDRTGALWFATERALYRHEKGLVRVYTSRDGLPASTIRSITLDRHGTIWVGMDGGGIGYLENGKFRCYTQADGLAGDVIRAILEGADGSFWIGTYSGLSHFQNGTFQNYTTAQGLSSNRVRSLYEDREGTLWIGTYGGGLDRLKNGKISQFTTREGLFNDVVYQILEDNKDRLWMSCNKGIFSASKKEFDAFCAGQIKRINCDVFNKSDGMGTNECNGGNPAGWKTTDGKIWFVSLKGLIMIDPDNLSTNKLLPPVVIEQIVVGDQRYDSQAVSVFPPGVRQFEIHYTALSYLAPDRVRFSYMLEGVDDKWVDAGTRRVAYYTRIPPGAYRFRVIACNNDGLWNRRGASIQVSLEPHFYETRLFYFATVLALITGAAFLVAFRIRQLKQRERILEARVDEAISKIKVLDGLLPICAACKKIRDDRGYWNQLEIYIRDHSEADFSHGMCPDCARKLYPELFKCAEDQTAE